MKEVQRDRVTWARVEREAERAHGGGLGSQSNVERGDPTRSQEVHRRFISRLSRAGRAGCGPDLETGRQAQARLRTSSNKESATVVMVHPAWCLARARHCSPTKCVTLVPPSPG